MWKWAIECGQGKAWLYYVFAICQWLPTNHRMNYTKDEIYQHCNFCFLNAPDGMDHILQCPALRKEHLHLKEELKTKFIQWNIPYSSVPRKCREVETRCRWSAAAQKKFAPQITDSRINIITKDCWCSNTHKQFVSTSVI